MHILHNMHLRSHWIATPHLLDHCAPHPSTYCLPYHKPNSPSPRRPEGGFRELAAVPCPDSQQPYIAARKQPKSASKTQCASSGLFQTLAIEKFPPASLAITPASPRGPPSYQCHPTCSGRHPDLFGTVIHPQPKLRQASPLEKYFHYCQT